MKDLNLKFSSDEGKNKQINKTVQCIIMTVIATVIYSLGVMWFLDPAKLYSGGVTGFAQLISHLIEIILSKNGVTLPFNIVGILVMILNIPILIYGWKGVSKLFVVCSIISIALQTVIMSGFIPTPDFGINTGANPLLGEADTGAGTMDILLLVLVGGGISGFGSALALRYGGSTGGVDILAQALSIKKHISIGRFSLIVNSVIAILGAALYGSPAIAIYTFFRIIIYSIVVDKVHTSYNFLRIKIVTNYTEEVSNEIFRVVHRGVTIYHAEGGYTHQNHDTLETIVSNYEVADVVALARKIDGNAFITVSPVNNVYGNFTNKPLA